LHNRMVNRSHMQLFSQFHYAGLLVLSLLQAAFDSPVDAARAAAGFCQTALEPMIWLATELFQRDCRPLAVQILEWLLFYVEKLIAGLTTVRCEGVQGLVDQLPLLRSKMLDFLASDLLDAAVVGPDRVKRCLNSYYQLIARDQHSIADLMAAIQRAYHSREDAGALPCEAQLYANLGTGFISHRISYQIGKVHVQLAQVFFEESLALLPAQVCRKQKDHLKKNIRVARLVPSVLDVVHSISIPRRSGNGVFCPSTTTVPIASLNEAESNRDVKDWCSAIRFVMQMISEGQRSVELIVRSLQNLASVFQEVNPDLARKCCEWASSATSAARDMYMMEVDVPSLA